MAAAELEPIAVLGVFGDRPVMVRLEQQSTVADLRARIWEACRIPPLEQQLLRGQRVLQDAELVYGAAGELPLPVQCQRVQPSMDPVLGEKLLSEAELGDVEGVATSLHTLASVNYAHPQDGRTALHVAARRGDVPLTNYLLWPAVAEKNKRMKGGLTPLHCAATAGNLEVARILCENSADVKLQTEDGQNVLHLAARAGDIQMLEVVNRVDLDKDMGMQMAWTPMHVAAFYGHTAAVSSLRSMGATASLSADDGRTPLHLAAAKGFLPVCQALREASADLNIQAKNGWTALHYAALPGHLDVCRYLLSEGADNLVLATEGGSPLHMAAAMGHVKVASLWCVAGVNLDLQMEGGASPLHVAVVNGHQEVVEVLCKGGAHQDLGRSDGASPLYLAVESDRRSIVDLLIGLGADIFKRTREGQVSPTCRAVQLGNVAVLGSLLDAKADADLPVRFGGTAMTIAAEAKNFEMVKLLISAGADKEAVGEDRLRRPLHAAAEVGSAVTVQLLIEGGAELDPEMAGGWTALSLAARQGHVEVARLLCEGGADKEKAVSPNMTPLLFAADCGHEEVARLLHGLGADAAKALKSAKEHQLRVAHSALTSWLGMPTDEQTAALQ